MVDFKSPVSVKVEQFGLCLLAFFLDGSLKSSIHSFNSPTFQVSIQLLLMVFVMLELRNQSKSNYMFWYALVLGILYDSYYSGVFGLYTIVFPLTEMIVKAIKRIIPDSLLFEWSAYFIVLTLSMIYLYFVGKFLGVTDVNFIHFIAYWLWPSLLINSIFFVILYIPLSKTSDWLMNH